MQTFMPHFEIEECAWILDYKRAPKNTLEASQIISIILKKQFAWNAGYRKDGIPKVIPWSNHPAVLLWENHIDALCGYFNTFYEVCCLKRRLWRGDNSLACHYPIERLPCPHTGSLRWIDPNASMPPLVLSEAFLSSHRAALLAKFPEWYEQFGWIEKPKIDYVWK